MKLCLLLFASSLVFAADWDAVQRIPAAQRIEVTERSGGGRLRATLVSASPDTVVVREPSGERSNPQADIRELRVFDPWEENPPGSSLDADWSGRGGWRQFGGMYQLRG